MDVARVKALDAHVCWAARIEIEVEVRRLHGCARGLRRERRWSRWRGRSGLAELRLRLRGGRLGSAGLLGEGQRQVGNLNGRPLLLGLGEYLRAFERSFRGSGMLFLLIDHLVLEQVAVWNGPDYGLNE